MSRRLYPHNRVRYWYAYDVDEICALYADLNLHPQTIRKWIKNGLSTIDAGKPALIYGQKLIAFLKKNNQSNKCKTAFEEFFCMRCQDARPVYRGEISATQKAKFVKVQAKCRTCKAGMYKNYKMADLANLKNIFKLVDVSQLYDDAKPTSKTHIAAQDKQRASESLQGDLFL
ncbi:MAG: hypothetical protein ABJN24_01140 [Hyphomicrobiales bacterium]